MRDRQPEKNNPYWLPETLYKKVVAIVRDYDRMREEYDEIINGSHCSDGMPRGGEISDPTATKAMRIAEKVSPELEAIEQALICVPEEYRTPVYNKVCYDTYVTGFPHGKNFMTDWKSKFCYWVAENLGLV